MPRVKVSAAVIPPWILTKLRAEALMFEDFKTSLMLIRQATAFEKILTAIVS